MNKEELEAFILNAQTEGYGIYIDNTLCYGVPSYDYGDDATDITHLSMYIESIHSTSPDERFMSLADVCNIRYYEESGTIEFNIAKSPIPHVLGLVKYKKITKAQLKNEK